MSLSSSDVVEGGSDSIPSDEVIDARIAELQSRNTSANSTESSYWTKDGDIYFVFLLYEDTESNGLCYDSQRDFQLVRGACRVPLEGLMAPEEKRPYQPSTYANEGSTVELAYADGSSRFDAPLEYRIVKDGQWLMLCEQSSFIQGGEMMFEWNCSVAPRATGEDLGFCTDQIKRC